MRSLSFAVLTLSVLLCSCSDAPETADSRLEVVYFDGDPTDRSGYLELVHSLEKQGASAVFLDVAFVSPPADSADQFAQDLHAGIPVYSDAMLHPQALPDMPYEYFDYLGKNIAGLRSTEAAGLWEMQGLEVPYKDFLQQSPGVVVPFLTPDNEGVVRFVGLYAYHRGYLLEQAALTLANTVLKKGGDTLLLSEDKLSLRKRSYGRAPQDLLSRRGLAQPLGFDLSLVDFHVIHSTDILSGKAKVAPGTLVMVGLPAGKGDDIKTAKGIMPGVVVLANAVNDLLWMARDR